MHLVLTSSGNFTSVCPLICLHMVVQCLQFYSALKMNFKNIYYFPSLPKIVYFKSIYHHFFLQLSKQANNCFLCFQMCPVQNMSSTYSPYLNFSGFLLNLETEWHLNSLLHSTKLYKIPHVVRLRKKKLICIFIYDTKLYILYIYEF